MKKIKVVCNNCMGKGFISAYDHIANGICFSCNGTGYKEVNKNYLKQKEKKSIKLKEQKAITKEQQHENYISRKHEEALKMNEEYDRRKAQQNNNNESVEDAIDNFLNWINE